MFVTSVLDAIGYLLVVAMLVAPVIALGAMVVFELVRHWVRRPGMSGLYYRLEPPAELRNQYSKTEDPAAFDRVA